MDAPTPAAVEASQLTRTYPPRTRRENPLRALDDVSFTIPAQRRVALLGPNGSGKSTLLRLLATLDTPDSGSLRILGLDARDPRQRQPIRASLGVVFQSPALDRLLTIRENLTTQAALLGLPRAQAARRAQSAAAQLNLSDRLDHRVATLSGGLARRADLARALLASPALLLLDEPTTGLDPAARADFLRLLARPHADDSPPTIILSTHLLDEAEHADHVLLLHGGRIAAQGHPAALRAALGSLVLRVEHAPQHLLDSARRAIAAQGLDAAPAPTGGLYAPVAEHHQGAVPKLISTLSSLGAAVRLGPPDLADVYLRATGHSLDAPEGANP